MAAFLVGDSLATLLSQERNDNPATPAAAHSDTLVNGGPLVCTNSKGASIDEAYAARLELRGGLSSTLVAFRPMLTLAGRSQRRGSGAGRGLNPTALQHAGTRTRQPVVRQVISLTLLTPWIL